MVKSGNYSRKYSKEWDKEDGLREWVSRVPGDDTKAACRYCRTVIRAHRADLKVHSLAKKHKKNAELSTITGLFAAFPYGDKGREHTVDKDKADMKGEGDERALDAAVGEIVNPASVGFIGCGNMAQAMLTAFLKKGLVNPSLTIASAPSDRNLGKLRELGVRTTQDNNDVVISSDLVFVCVKPHQLTSMLGDLPPLGNHSPLFVSVVTGVSLGHLETMLCSLVENPRVVRAMPNTPSAVGQGCCLYALGTHTTPSDAETTSSLLSALGMSAQIPEYQIDAACGLSGSGPAYIYMAIEALADGGVKMGLPRQLAQTLAAQTVKGAGAMVLETGKHPGQLKDEVCSPGGTTIAAVHTLEQNSFRNSLISAVEASALRSKELGAKE
ncbi:Pyrroline-5-carboxylate reductase 2 [Chionoecetes opilio]|uniref:Pyrroline-5-carboxylate reductase n=1 Tax=Chionoecetes opilio TaxID=41210 RepID=A0A8J4XWH3_CHIOP|nr:Pyrroline-5-carboxylate reductase 2 [Chionoecetes opilio]